MSATSVQQHPQALREEAANTSLIELEQINAAQILMQISRDTATSFVEVEQIDATQILMEISKAVITAADYAELRYLTGDDYHQLVTSCKQTDGINRLEGLSHESRERTQSPLVADQASGGGLSSMPRPPGPQYDRTSSDEATVIGIQEPQHQIRYDEAMIYVLEHYDFLSGTALATRRKARMNPADKENRRLWVRVQLEMSVLDENKLPFVNMSGEEWENILNTWKVEDPAAYKELKRPKRTNVDFIKKATELYMQTGQFPLSRPETQSREKGPVTRAQSMAGPSNAGPATASASGRVLLPEPSTSPVPITARCPAGKAG